MKILITGKHSYIGSSVKAWLNEKEPSFLVDEVSLRNIDIDKLTFNQYDAIIHVVGIAHISSKKKLIPEYFKINRDLAIKVAKKAKSEGVKEFIYTSSIAIYGNDNPIFDFRPIDIKNPKPKNAYAQSKFEADLTIQGIADDNFKVSILRIPMVYGKNAKGKLNKLIKISKFFPIFPNIFNQRSVIHINNLSELIRLILVKKLNGVFLPQDKTYFSTNNFIKYFRASLNKKTLFITFFPFFLRFMAILIPEINKVYGNKFYESKLSTIKAINYQIYDFKDFIKEYKNIT